jgi:hypothetical protein
LTVVTSKTTTGTGDENFAMCAFASAHAGQPGIVAT